MIKSEVNERTVAVAMKVHKEDDIEETLAKELAAIHMALSEKGYKEVLLSVCIATLVRVTGVNIGDLDDCLTKSMAS